MGQTSDESSQSEQNQLAPDLFARRLIIVAGR